MKIQYKYKFCVIYFCIDKSGFFQFFWTSKCISSYYPANIGIDKSKKFKVGKASSLAKLYNEIADQNGLEDRKSSIRESIYDEAKIYLPNTYEFIYAEAQFIIDEEIRLKEKAKQKRDEESGKLFKEEI